MQNAIDNTKELCYPKVAKRNYGGVDLVNTDKIKGRMRELKITQKDVALALKIAQPTINQKINNVRPFNLSEAESLATLLKIDDSAFANYFFT